MSVLSVVSDFFYWPKLIFKIFFALKIKIKTDISVLSVIRSDFFSTGIKNPAY